MQYREGGIFHLQKLDLEIKLLTQPLQQHEIPAIITLRNKFSKVMNPVPFFMLPTTMSEINIQNVSAANALIEKLNSDISLLNDAKANGVTKERLLELIKISGYIELVTHRRVMFLQCVCECIVIYFLVRFLWG